MTEPKRNLPASVAARLLQRAKRTGDDYQTLFKRFCFERFLHRLGESDAKDRFVLKGAMLLRLWSDQPYRATGDLDLLRRGNGSFDAIREDITAICTVAVEPDTVVFNPAALCIETIRAEDEYAGTRVTLPARSGTVQLMLQIDMGLGDSVWPAPQSCVYPSLLEFPPATVFAYPPEVVIAEKLEAIVVLGNRNSRIKDFFDLQYLAGRFEFDRPTLSETVRRTFARRNTPIPTDEPIGLTPAYWENPSRPPQIRAFARRAGLAVTATPGPEILAQLRPFLLPILDDLRSDTRRPGTWRPSGPWMPFASDQDKRDPVS
jgi:hypothetical protein